MPEHGSSTATHLSIGEVLALVLEEFPDVTISKIRFLESQGLIDPERTPSGYRKFYDDDVELLRCILREQRENYLPLRVIKDRLDSGEIDPTNEQPRPVGVKNVSMSTDGGETLRTDDDVEHPAGWPTSRSDAAAANFFAPPGPDGATSDSNGAASDDHQRGSPPAAPQHEPLPVPPGGLDSDEVCSLTSLTSGQLAELVSYGVVVASDTGGSRFDDRALEIATVAKRLLDAGLDARHLRGWRVAVDREAGLYEQMIQPLLRQRNPEAQEEALVNLRDLERLGADLHTALMRDALHPHLDD
jgi:DNA-binding transcriptional MerR regulator